MSGNESIIPWFCCVLKSSLHDASGVNCKFERILVNKFCSPIYLLGYNVPTRVAPKFVLRCLGLFDGSIKMILPQIGQEAHFDNSKVMYAVKSIIFASWCLVFRC